MKWERENSVCDNILRHEEKYKHSIHDVHQTVPVNQSPYVQKGQHERAQRPYRRHRHFCEYAKLLVDTREPCALWTMMMIRMITVGKYKCWIRASIEWN